MNEVTDVAVDLGMTLIGQVHSHPGTFVDLSIPDRKYGIKVPGFLSVVAPHYATRPGTSIANCGVHVFDRDRGYERLPRSEEHTSELQSLMRISYAVFCLKKKKPHKERVIEDRRQQLLIKKI